MRSLLLSKFFLVESRSKTGLDQHLPASGLNICYCDTLGIKEFRQGTGQRHYQCALLQADGLSHLEHNVNQGDGTDLFAAVNGVAASNATSPSTRMWSGADSGLVISDVSVPDVRIGFRVGARAAQPAVHGENLTPHTISDNQPGGISSAIQIGAAGKITRLALEVDITHPYIGDLLVELVSPDGARALLRNRTGAGSDNLVQRYDSLTVAPLAALVGRAAQGNWVFKISDLDGQDVGQLNRWSLDLTVDAAAGTASASGEASPNMAIPDTDPTGVSSSIAIARAGSIGQIKVAVDITHTYIGDLRIELTSPGGRSVVLHSQLGGGQDNLVVAYDSAPRCRPCPNWSGR